MDEQLDLDYLKRLAAVCRKSGIKSFKGQGIEFELSEFIQQPSRRRAKAPEKKKILLSTPEGDVLTDTPSEADMLYWSVGTPETDSA